MPIPWIAILSKVPWKQVIDHAPTAVDGARKLWHSVRHKKEADPQPPEELASDAPPTLASLQARIAALEAAQAETEREMLAASALLQTLAEQNAQLVARLEMQRVRQRRLFYLATGALLCALLAGIAALRA